jgi:hypothetical protein
VIIAFPRRRLSSLFINTANGVKITRPELKRQEKESLSLSLAGWMAGGVRSANKVFLITGNRCLRAAGSNNFNSPS